MFNYRNKKKNIGYKKFDSAVITDAVKNLPNTLKLAIIPFLTVKKYKRPKTLAFMRCSGP